jgi:hypothetical protein
MSIHKFLCWMYGVGFAIAFIMSQVAISQRDDARAFQAQMGGVELVCMAVKP